MTHNLKIVALTGILFSFSDLQAQKEAFPLHSDQQGTISFDGSETAKTYTKIAEASFKDIFIENYISELTGDYTPGFVRASIVPKPCHNQMWTRDVGTLIREMVACGMLNHACQTSLWLMTKVDKNEEGYYLYPEYFYPGEKKSGKELDGTTAIVMGLIDLWRALPASDPFKDKIYNFLNDPASPLKYIIYKLTKQPLIGGKGEFGGGVGIDREYYNVVQNHMVALALTSAQKMEKMKGNLQMAAEYGKNAQAVLKNIEKYLVGKDRSWIWCVDLQTLKPDSALLNGKENKGFGGQNGVLSMYADVKGFQPLKDNWNGIQYSINTFNRLYNTPYRKMQFEKYGLWTQFDLWTAGTVTSPSYGTGYAMQVMLLTDKLEMFDKKLKWFVNETVNPLKEYTDLKRKSPYHIYERYYSPEAVGKVVLEEGCGELNLVNITEQMKVTRLILGLDNMLDTTLCLIPRLPASITTVTANNWPLYTKKGMSRVNIICTKENGKSTVSLKVISGPAIDQINVLMPGDSKMTVKKNVKDMKLEY